MTNAVVVSDTIDERGVRRLVIREPDDLMYERTFEYQGDKEIGWSARKLTPPELGRYCFSTSH